MPSNKKEINTEDKYTKLVENNLANNEAENNFNPAKIKIGINKREYITWSRSIGWGLVPWMGLRKSLAWLIKSSLLSIANLFIKILITIKPTIVDRRVSIVMTKIFLSEAEEINNLFTAKESLLIIFFVRFIYFDKYSKLLNR